MDGEAPGTGRFRTPDKSWVSPVLFVLFIITSGCIFLDSDDGVRLPAPPGELEAHYTISVDGKPIMNATVEGFETKETRLGDGSLRQAEMLTISYERAGWRDWTLKLHHDPTGQRLLAAELICHGTSGDGVQQACPRNDPEAYTLVFHDAFTAPGLLGLGPFLGTNLEPGDQGRLDLWDPVDPGTLSWTAQGNSTSTDTACMTLETAWQNRSAKTPLPTLPYTRSMEVCDGVPLPREISAGPVHWELETWSSDDHHPRPAPDLATPPVRGSTSDCRIDFPSHNKTILPSPAYVEWAEENDSKVSRWMREHPNGFPLPSFARAATTGRGTTSNTYVVNGFLQLFDPGTGVFTLLSMEEEHRRTLLFEESSFEPSKKLGSVSGLPPMERMCPAAPVDLAEIETIVQARLPSSAVTHTTFLAPELMWGYQGLGPWTWPYQHQTRDTWDRIRERFEPETWPYRAYVSYLPDGEGVALIDAASVDPGGDWLRWIELEPES